MTRDETIALLRRHADDIRGFAVTGLYLFGSTAGGEAEPSSDVDLFIDYAKAGRPVIAASGVFTGSPACADDDARLVDFRSKHLRRRYTAIE